MPDAVPVDVLSPHGRSDIFFLTILHTTCLSTMSPQVLFFVIYSIHNPSKVQFKCTKTNFDLYRMVSFNKIDICTIFLTIITHIPDVSGATVWYTPLSYLIYDLVKLNQDLLKFNLGRFSLAKIDICIIYLGVINCSHSISGYLKYLSQYQLMYYHRMAGVASHSHHSTLHLPFNNGCTGATLCYTQHS